MRKYTVCIVDDDEEDLEIMRDVFDAVNCADTLLLFRSAEELLGKMAESGTSVPHLMILDHQTTGMSGAQALQLLKEDARYAHTTFVVYSSHVTPNLCRDLKNKGADFCVAKATTIDEIMRQVNVFCARVAEKQEQE